MSKRVLCKFFASEGCLKGENCNFSHDWKAPASSGICKLYQKGVCSYGRRCRYQHVRVSQSQPSDPSPSTERKWVPVEHHSGSTITISNVAEAEVKERSSSNRPITPSIAPANREISRRFGKQKSEMSVNHADKSLCSFPTAGDCPSGDKCPHVHGDLCPTCEKHCLHPFRPKEREEHMETCQKLKRQLETIRLSKDIECNVCLERVLSKPTPAERKFGILPECGHPFCVSCIRNWRRISAASGVDVNSAVRACPTCRKVSYFVVPSSIWYSSEEEKQEIISSYKGKLSSIDCKHFKFGTGTCPFGSSCFYKHMVKPGASLWNQTRNPGAHSSRYPNTHRNRYHQDSDEEYESDSDGSIPDLDLEALFWEASRMPDTYGMSDMVLEAMFWEASRNPDMYGPLSEDMDEIGPIDNPDIPSFHSLLSHLYHPRVSMDEERDQDCEEESTEDLDDIMADLTMLSMLHADMVNLSSDDE